MSEDSFVIITFTGGSECFKHSGFTLSVRQVRGEGGKDQSAAVVVRDFPCGRERVVQQPLWQVCGEGLDGVNGEVFYGYGEPITQSDFTLGVW